MLRTLGRLLLAIAAISIPVASPANAQDAARRAPELGISQKLAPYSDNDRVRTSLKNLIDFLGAAKFEPREDGYTSECAEIFRGMQLVHGGLYLFASKQEIGWYEYINPTQTTPPRSIVDFGRSSLLRVWPPDRIHDLLGAMNGLKQ